MRAVRIAGGLSRVPARLAVAAVLALASCGGSEEPPRASLPGEAAPAPAPSAPADAGPAPAVEPERQAPAEPPSTDAFVLDGHVPLGDDRASVRSALGEPVATSAETVPNRHVPGVVDTLVVLEYPGLAVHFHRPGGEGAGDLLSQVVVRDARWLRFGSPTIGTSLAEVERLLGRPHEVSGEGFLYRCERCEGGERFVELLIAELQVHEIRFHYYVD